MSVLELFCHVDDFCRAFEPVWHRQRLTSGSKQRNRARELALSEMMTMLILFHQSHYRTFKAFYTEHVCAELRSEFPTLVSYTRFVEFFPSTLVPLCVYLYSCLGACTGVLFVASTKLAVCHNRRIGSIGSSVTWPHVARPQSISFSASSCIWSSMTKVRC
jgi:hypothetical protein